MYAEYVGVSRVPSNSMVRFIFAFSTTLAIAGIYPIFRHTHMSMSNICLGHVWALEEQAASTSTVTDDAKAVANAVAENQAGVRSVS